MERMQLQGDSSRGQFPPRSARSETPGPDSSGTLRPRASSSPGQHKALPTIGAADLPPPPAPAGLNKVVHTIFGGFLPLHVFWRLMRILWLVLGLAVIGVVAVQYCADLLSGQLPAVTEAFATSPLLEAPSLYPLPFLAGAGVFLLFTILTWGAALEHHRVLEARAEQVRRAIRAGVRVEQLDEKTHHMLAAGDANGTFLLATHAHEQNRLPDAIVLYQLVLQKAPKHFGAHYNLGLIFAESGQWEQAEEYCRATVLLNADSADAQGLMGFVLYQLGYLEEAQRRARLAVRMGFPAEKLEMLIKPGLGVTSSQPAVRLQESGDV